MAGMDDTRVARMERTLSVLNGEVPRAADLAALRRGDLAGPLALIKTLQASAAAQGGELTQIREAAAVPVPDLTSAPVAAPPTAEDFNALQADAAALRQALLALVQAFD